MTAILNIYDNILKQFAIHLKGPVATYILSILLYCPHSPQGHIGLIHLIDFDAQRVTFHKLAQTTFRRVHHQLKIVGLINCQCQPRQRDKCITGTALEPRIASQQITGIICLTVMELMGSRYQTVIEIITRHTQIQFFLEHTLQRTRFHLRRRSCEDNGLTLLDRHLEITRYIKILIRSIATLLLLRIFYATIPVGLEDKLIFLIELHEQIGIALVHTCLDTVVNQLIITACH